MATRKDKREVHSVLLTDEVGNAFLESGATEGEARSKARARAAEQLGRGAKLREAAVMRGRRSRPAEDGGDEGGDG